MRKTLTIASALAVCAALTYLYIYTEVPSAEAEEEEHHHDEFVHFTEELCKTHGIASCPSSSGNLKRLVRAPAKITLVADQIAHVLPKVSGIVQAAYKNLGETVAAGDLLATLDSKEMAEAKSLYLSSLKKEHLLNKAFEREQSLFSKSITSDQDYQAAANARESAAIDTELARQKLYALGLDSSEVEKLSTDQPHSLLKYDLRAPIFGLVTSRHITPGEMVTSDHEVYVIANLDTVWAEISVFPRDRQYVKQGQPVSLSSHEGQSTVAKVSYLSPVIDQETLTSTAIVEIDNRDGSWLPGAFCQAEILADETPVSYLVPKTAVQEVDGKKVLFIKDQEEGGFIVRPITIGRDDEQHYEVTEGLKEGETYAFQNTFLLKAELEKDEAEHMD